MWTRRPCSTCGGQNKIQVIAHKLQLLNAENPTARPEMLLARVHHSFDAEDMARPKETAKHQHRTMDAGKEVGARWPGPQQLRARCARSALVQVVMAYPTRKAAPSQEVVGALGH